MISDFSIRLSFRPDQKDRQNDFDAYLKEDAGRNYEGDRSAVKMAAKNNVKIGEFRYSRLDFTLDGAEVAAGEARRESAGPVKGFWLDGDKLSIISDLREAEGAAINERIIGTVRKASGYGVTDCSPVPFPDYWAVEAKVGETAAHRSFRSASIIDAVLEIAQGVE